MAEGEEQQPGDDRAGHGAGGVQRAEHAEGPARPAGAGIEGNQGVLGGVLAALAQAIDGAQRGDGGQVGGERQQRPADQGGQIGGDE